jgi:hypothetical protein
MRYDLAPVPFMLAGALLLLASPGLPRAAVAGALFGLAGLLQFDGAFMIPIAVLFLALEALPARRRLALVSALIGGSLLAFLPYGLYIAGDYTDFRGQAGTLDGRTDFLRPGFYLDNLKNEADRFLRPLAFKEVPRGADFHEEGPRWLSLHETLTRRPSAKVAVLIGLPASLLFFAWRTRQRSRADRLMLLGLGGLVLQYALFDSTKFYIYWIPVVPFLCIGIAASSLRLLARAMQRPARGRLLPRLAAGATLLVLLVFFAEGSVARIGGIRTASNASSYAALGTAIHEYVPAGARVVGSTSLWWDMRDNEYRSYFLFFYLTRPDAGPYRTTISGFLQEYDARYLVLTSLAESELEKSLIPADYADWQAYMAAHARKLVRLEGPVAAGYGYVDVWQID